MTSLRIDSATRNTSPSNASTNESISRGSPASPGLVQQVQELTGALRDRDAELAALRTELAALRQANATADVGSGGLRIPPPPPPRPAPKLLFDANALKGGLGALKAPPAPPRVGAPKLALDANALKNGLGALKPPAAQAARDENPIKHSLGAVKPTPVPQAALDATTLKNSLGALKTRAPVAEAPVVTPALSELQRKLQLARQKSESTAT